MNYDLNKVTQFFNGLNNYFAEEGTFEEVRDEFINDIKKNGMLAVCKSIVDVVLNTPEGVETEEGVVDNEDAAKCMLTEMLYYWNAPELDDETKMFLKYNEKNVWWL